MILSPVRRQRVIELLIGPDDSPVPVFPTTRLHVQAAVTAALAGNDQAVG